MQKVRRATLTTKVNEAKQSAVAIVLGPRWARVSYKCRLDAQNSTYNRWITKVKPRQYQKYSPLWEHWQQSRPSKAMSNGHSPRLLTVAKLEKSVGVSACTAFSIGHTNVRYVRRFYIKQNTMIPRVTTKTIDRFYEISFRFLHCIYCSLSPYIFVIYGRPDGYPNCLWSPSGWRKQNNRSNENGFIVKRMQIFSHS